MTLALLDQDGASMPASAPPPPEKGAGPHGDGTGPAFHPVPVDPDCPYCRGDLAGLAGDAVRPADWSFVDAAYCISLRERDDRMALASAEFHKTGLCRKVLFHRPRRHPTRVIEGIWESHRAVARHALASGARTALIFEDDVLFTRKITRRRMTAVASAMRRLPDDWTIFFLGHWPLKARFWAPDILASASACAHAYIASPRLLAWLEAHPFERRFDQYDKRAGGGIDAAYARLPGSYAYFPMLAIQAVRRSDHMAHKKATKPVTKLKHLVTRTSLGEILLSRLMRPNELIIAGMGAVAGLVERLRRKSR